MRLSHFPGLCREQFLSYKMPKEYKVPKVYNSQLQSSQVKMFPNYTIPKYKIPKLQNSHGYKIPNGYKIPSFIFTQS